MAPDPTWEPLLEEQAALPYWSRLRKLISDERRAGPVFPPETEVLACLAHTPLPAVRVVILGQDPYHGAGQGHGLAFSVVPPTSPPPSLRNIFTELKTDIGCPQPQEGSLLGWAEQGVLLLNSVLTVREGEANSHRGLGWEPFTDAVLAQVDALPQRVVFILWGAAAQKKATAIDGNRHGVIRSPHPSPLSAPRGFFGSKPFSTANRLLLEANRQPIDWCCTGSQTNKV